MTLVDEGIDVVVLEDLDFEVPCCRGEHAAEFSYACRACRVTHFICAVHLADARRRYSAGCRCMKCKTRSADFDAAVEVVPL